ncbi:unnamed protein product [Peronospora destructor]|uniref:Elicitin n=1 Tax=Peronospora destructor TaxID=86335 RepID=A0AAV0UAG7_9STRA|nr:unnamed protein product [Peronospora destructor]
MKFAAIVSAAALAAVTNANMCDVSTLQKLLLSPDTKLCTTKSGYMVTSLKTPTNIQRDVMCSNTACQSILSQIKTLAPKECTLGTFSLYADLIDPVADHCNNGDSPAGSMATPIVTVESNNTTSKTTTSNVTGSESESASKTPTTSNVMGSESASKTPTTSSDHVYTFTPTTTDDTTVEQTTSLSDATDDTTVEQSASSSDPLDDTRTKQTTTPPSKNLDDTSAETTSGATSVSMAAVSAGVFVVTVATTIL